MKSLHGLLAAGLLLIPAFPLLTGQRDMLPVGLVAAAPFLVCWLGLSLMRPGPWRQRLTNAAWATGGLSLLVYALFLGLSDPFIGMLAFISLPAQSLVALAALIAGVVARFPQ